MKNTYFSLHIYAPRSRMCDVRGRGVCEKDFVICVWLRLHGELLIRRRTL